jgi:3-hydroxyacyl-CoA dehydrogenase / enoyl-CoA hydratase / 3-hydroxybutyryl-CoA epimerase
MNMIARDVLAGNIAQLVFDRPGSSANIFDRQTLSELERQIDSVCADNPRGLIFSSAKKSIFVAGADLHSLAEMDERELREYIEQGQRVFDRISSLPFPTVAAIHGACVGGGYELCLACDYRIATQDRATKIGLPEVKLGIIPAWGGSTRLPRLIGLPKALDVILNGKILAAKPANKRGMVDELAPREYLIQAAVAAIERKASHPPAKRLVPGMILRPILAGKLEKETRGHYPAVFAALDVVTRAPGSSVSKSLALERQHVLKLAATSACRNLVSLALRQDKAKKRPAGDTKKIERAAVIGAGVMGSSIAQWLSARGLQVVLRDIDASRVAAGMKNAAKLYDQAVKRHIMTSREARDGMSRIIPAAAPVPLKRTDLVIEAVLEKLDLKKKIFAELDSQTESDAVLATNTSALSISEIAAATKNPSRVVGIHFFNPVHKMQLVEAVVGSATAPEVRDAAIAFVQRIGKLPLVVKDSPGFLVNRVLLPYLIEAGHYFENGATIQDIDEAMLDFGMPMGPLRLIDEVGVDVAADVADEIAGAFAQRLRKPAVLKQMIEAQLLGRKNGHGFYTYRNGRAGKVNSDVMQFQTGKSAAALTRQQLQRRMVLLMVNEAARCVEEGIVDGADDADFGMVMGTGFAPFRGGPLAFADSEGLPRLVEEMRKLEESDGERFAPCELLKSMAAREQTFYEKRRTDLGN